MTNARASRPTSGHRDLGEPIPPPNPPTTARSAIAPWCRAQACGIDCTMRAHHEPMTAMTACHDNGSNDRYGQGVHSGPQYPINRPNGPGVTSQHEASLHLCTSVLTIRCSNSTTASEFILARLKHEIQKTLTVLSKCLMLACHSHYAVIYYLECP